LRIECAHSKSKARITGPDPFIELYVHQRVMVIINQYGLRHFWVLSRGGHK
jgi:hypothetical protein